MQEKGIALHKGKEATDIRIVFQARPSIQPTEILLEVKYVGICGSDYRIYANEKEHVPGVFGHEVVAKIVDVGSKVSGYSMGDVVTINPVNAIDDNDIIGYNGNGFLSSFFVVDQLVIEQQRIFAFPKYINLLDAVFAEQLSCCVHAQSKIRTHFGADPIVVIGSGSFGLLHLLLAMHWGAQDVYLTAKSPVRLNEAVKRGIIRRERVFSFSEDEHGISEKLYNKASIVIITANGINPIKQALPLMKENGIILLFGGLGSNDVYEGHNFASLRRNQRMETIKIEGKFINVVGSYGTDKEDFETSVDVISQSKIPFHKLITHTVSLDGLIEIMPLFKNGIAEDTPILKLITEL